MELRSGTLVTASETQRRLPDRWLVAILVVALFVRVAAACGIQRHLDQTGGMFLIAGDADGYWQLAQRLANGEEYSVYTPPRQVLRMPGFPAVLALGIRLFGTNLLPTRIMLATCGTVACGLVYCLGRELFDLETGRVAAALAAVSPVFVGSSPLILSETVFSAALLASLLGCARLIRHHQSESPRSGLALSVHAVIVGALIALACYVRPTWLIAGPLCGAMLVSVSRMRRRAWIDAALIQAAILLALLPWGLRNQRVTGQFVLTTLWVGPSLYDGLNPQATGESDMAFFDRDNLMGEHGFSEYAVDRHYRSESWKFVRENPGRTVELALVKLGRYWSPLPNAPQFRRWWIELLVGGWFVLMVVLAAWGAWRERRRTWQLALCLGPILAFAAVHMVFVSSLRYRLPAEYPFVVVSALGLLHVRRLGFRGSAPT